ncbi:DUF1566 domain-containing protein [Pseudomonas sichuanensis]
MKSEMVKLEHNGLRFKARRLRLAELALADAMGHLPPASNHPEIIAPPIGQPWPGQGGINGGFVPAIGYVPAHYLIFAHEDVGEHEWGGRNQESKAASRHDGNANTDALVAEGGHPAAEAARAYQSEGHSDFDLPAASQLYQAWVHNLIKEGAYWSSSQRSAYNAFYMGFDDGNQDFFGKFDELRVRPVRRYFI